jgi:hypothetical protein
MIDSVQEKRRAWFNVYEGKNPESLPSVDYDSFDPRTDDRIDGRDLVAIWRTVTVMFMDVSHRLEDDRVFDKLRDSLDSIFGQGAGEQTWKSFLKGVNE